MPSTDTRLRSSERPSAPGRSESGRIRVLVVDYSVGFGGATKGMALMLRGMPHVQPVIVTSQEPDVSALWYGSWPTYSFRRRINYRSRWMVQEWAQQRPFPTLTSKILSKLFAAADSIVTLISAVRIRMLVRLHAIDLLHMTNGFGPPEVLLAGKLAGIPTIAHLRGFYSGSRSNKSAPSYAPALVIGASEAVIRGYRERAGHPLPSQSLYEAVEIDKFEAAMSRRDEIRSRHSIHSENIAVAIFGRVVSWKGHKEFVAALIAAMKQDERLIGFIVGDASDGTESYYADVNTMIRESGLEARFRMVGYIEEVEPYYCAADIVVHASIEPEPFGMVVTEAMAARRPVIAANSGGPLETVHDGIDGLLVDPKNTQDLAHAILRLAADPTLRATMGAAGFEKVRDHFDVPAVAGRLYSLYRMVLTDPSTSDETS